MRDDVAVQWPRHLARDGNDDCRRGRFVMDQQFAQMSVAVGERRARRRILFTPGGQRQNDKRRRHAEGDARGRLPTRHCDGSESKRALAAIGCGPPVIGLSGRKPRQARTSVLEHTVAAIREDFVAAIAWGVAWLPWF